MTKGWKQGELDGHFQRQRANADKPNANMERRWFELMRGAFAELDNFAHFVPRSGAFTFLDLG